MKIVIPNERPMSWNELYAGKHWSRRSDEAIRVHALVYQYLPETYKIFKKRVDIFITVYFKNRPFDSDNICSKFYVDGLKGRLIEDDSPKQVGFVAVRSEVDAEEPRVEILIK